MKLSDAVQRLDAATLKTIQFAYAVLSWESKIEYKVTEDGLHWTPNYKGVSFKQKEECQEFAFICWCSEHTPREFIV